MKKKKYTEIKIILLAGLVIIIALTLFLIYLLKNNIHHNDSSEQTAVTEQISDDNAGKISEDKDSQVPADAAGQADDEILTRYAGTLQQAELNMAIMHYRTVDYGDYKSASVETGQDHQGVIKYELADMDGDGQNEMIILRRDTGKDTDEYGLRQDSLMADIYECEDKKAVLKDSISLFSGTNDEAEWNSFIGGSDSDTAYVYLKNDKYLAAWSKGYVCVAADGSSIVSGIFSYDGTKWKAELRSVVSGSDFSNYEEGTVDEEYQEDYKKLCELGFIKSAERLKNECDIIIEPEDTDKRIFALETVNYFLAGQNATGWSTDVSPDGSVPVYVLTDEVTKDSGADTDFVSENALPELEKPSFENDQVFSGDDMEAHMELSQYTDYYGNLNWSQGYIIYKGKWYVLSTDQNEESQKFVVEDPLLYQCSAENPGELYTPYPSGDDTSMKITGKINGEDIDTVLYKKSVSEN